MCTIPRRVAFRRVLLRPPCHRVSLKARSTDDNTVANTPLSRSCPWKRRSANCLGQSTAAWAFPSQNPLGRANIFVVFVTQFARNFLLSEPRHNNVTQHTNCTTCWPLLSHCTFQPTTHCSLRWPRTHWKREIAGHTQKYFRIDAVKL